MPTDQQTQPQLGAETSDIHATVKRPTYWREVVVTAPAVFGLILLFETIFGSLVADLPKLAATALTVCFVVALLTWPVMPTAMRVFRPFLFPTTSTSQPRNEP